MSSTLPPEGPIDSRLGELLRPTETEAQALSATPPLWSRALASATEPTAAEIVALGRRRSAAPRPRRFVPIALLAAALLLAWILWPRPGAPPPSEVPAEVPGEPLAALGLQLVSPNAQMALTPDAWVFGTATVELLARDEVGATLRLHTGQAVFEVDPQGFARRIVVEAGAYTVTVTGTRFLVARQGERVEVAVERGSVRVDGPELSLALKAGARWESPEEVPQPEPPKPLPVEDVSPEPAPAVAPSHRAPSHRTTAAEWARLLDARESGMAADELLERVEAFLIASPDSPLSSEASFLKIELVVEAWPAARAIPAVEEWLLANPSSPRLPEGHLFRAHLLLAADPPNCAAARPSLVLARELGSPEVAAQAGRLPGCE
jgi:hypothetical protein